MTPEQHTKEITKKIIVCLQELIENTQWRISYKQNMLEEMQIEQDVLDRRRSYKKYSSEFLSDFQKSLDELYEKQKNYKEELVSYINSL